MNAKENFHVALANLKANKIRTIFSMLGIMIGTCSVIVVVAIVNGTRLATLDQMKAGKDNMLILRPRYSEAKGVFGSIHMDTIEKIKTLPVIQTAFPDCLAFR